MMKLRRSLMGVLGAALLAAIGTPAFAWDVIGTSEVNDRVDRDSIQVNGNRAYRHIKICVYRNPVRFYDVGVNFHNGGHQDVSVRSRINAGQCTRVIDLKGRHRDITSVNFTYEEASVRKRRATVKVYAE